MYNIIQISTVKIIIANKKHFYSMKKILLKIILRSYLDYFLILIIFSTFCKV